MSNNSNYSKFEDILENPGLFCFRIDNKTNSFVKGKKINNYGDKEVSSIKSNIEGVFQHISEEIKKYENDNPEYLGHIIDNLNSYNSSFKKKKFNFPGLQVINMDREKLDYFTHWPERFLLCEKSDGVRYLLIKYRNGKYHLVGRNLEFFEIELNYSEKLPPPYSRINLYNEWSIEYFLDGELILDDADEENDEKSKIIKINGKNKKINFLIFDAVVLKGLNIGHLPFKKRLEELSRVFNEEYEALKYANTRGKSFLEKFKQDIQNSNFLNINKLKKDIKSSIKGTNSNIISSNSNNKIITLYVKDYYTFENINKLNELIKLLPHHNDGLIINVDDYPYYSGQSCEIFKWKPLEMNTIDFEIIYNEKIKKYILYITTNSKEGNIPVEILCFGSNEEKNNFEKIYNNNKNYNSYKNIGECYYDSKLFNDESIIINYNISLVKKENDEDITEIFSSFVNKIPNNKEKYKGGWRFLKFRNDKLNSNYINTYQNIKICIKEDLQMKEIIDTVEKNREKKLIDLSEEKNFMSALIWKRFFKKKKNSDDFDLFEEENNNEIKNEFLNKKRNSPDVKDDEEIVNEEDNKGNEDKIEEIDLNKLYDDDDDYYN